MPNTASMIRPAAKGMTQPIVGTVLCEALLGLTGNINFYFDDLQGTQGRGAGVGAAAGTEQNGRMKLENVLADMQSDDDR